MDKTRFAYQQKLDDANNSYWNMRSTNIISSLREKQRCEKAREIREFYQSRANDD